MNRRQRYAKFQSPDEDSFTPKKVTKIWETVDHNSFQSPDEDSFAPKM